MAVEMSPHCAGKICFWLVSVGTDAQRAELERLNMEYFWFELQRNFRLFNFSSYLHS